MDNVAQARGKGKRIAVSFSGRGLTLFGGRLLHHCHIIAASGRSYRIKDKLEKVKKGD